MRDCERRQILAPPRAPLELKVRAPGLDQEFVGQGPVGEQLLSAIDDQLGLQDPVVPDVDAPSSGSFS